MAININTLITGSMSIGSSGHAETIFTFAGNRTASKNISGELSNPWKWDESEHVYILDYDGSDVLYETDLISIDIGNTVTSIGIEAFYDCSNLTSVTIPDGVTNIWGMAFHGCSSLTSVTIPNSVTRIWEEVFYGCSSLLSVTIGNSVQIIDELAFKNCSSLTSVTIPASVTNIGSEIFSGCSGLTSVTFIGKTLEQVQNIESVYGDKYYPWGLGTSVINVA